MIDYMPYLLEINQIADEIEIRNKHLDDFKLMMYACDIYIKQKYNDCYEIIKEL